METLEYEVVDVFTDRAYAGNPLAVVLAADELSTDQMQRIAREMNLSETTFVVRPTSDADYRIRIFSPEREMPFAGHPSVGSAVTLARRGLVKAGAVVQECLAGLMPVEIDGDRATLTGGAPSVSEPLDPAPLLAAVGLSPSDLAGPEPRHAGVGLPHTYLAVRPDAVSRATLHRAAAASGDIRMLTVFARTGDRVHLRMFAPRLSTGEDPATGSSALGLGVYLAAAGLVGEGTTAYTVSQGAEIERPSTLECTVTVADGRVTRTTVAGRVTPVARGSLVAPE